MSATFACPHCGASYPFKPVLVGRAVRCTTCRNPFQLRADGIADKVVVPTAAAPAAAPAAVVGSAEEISTPVPAGRSPTASAPRGTRTERLSRQQEEARRTMANSLSHAASAALSAESVKREAQAEKKTERNQALARPGASTGEGRVGDIGPAVLTGSGLRDHRNHLAWLLGVITVVGVICALVVLVSRKSPQRQALIAYAAEVAPARNRYPDRIAAIQERAWLMGIPALTDLGRVTLGKTRVVAFLPAREVLTKRIKGLTYLPAYQVWIAPQRVAELDPLWNPHKDRATNLAQLQERKLAVVDQRVVGDELQAVGWSADDVALLLELIQGRTDRSGANWIGRHLTAGTLPDAIELTPFSGTKGVQLLDRGREFMPRRIDYRGTVLRFIGAGWPGECKVLEITATTSD